MIAVDLETDQESRILLILAAGSDRRALYVSDPAGAPLDKAFSWMVHCLYGSLCIGYFFEFDAQMLLRLLPPAHLAQLRARGSVLWRRWRVRHIPDKMLSVTDRILRRTATVWNVSGWTQCSFVKLITDWKLGTPEEREFVSEMKRRRADWSNTTEQEMIRYTTLECALLCDWFSEHLRLHENLDLKLSSYTGAGATARSMIARAGWRPPEVPEPVLAAAEAAYYGGRSEISCIGPVDGPVHGYDIHSAYPAAAAEMPQLAGARWFHVKQHIAGAWGFWRVRWRQSEECWGLFPVRGARLQGGRRSLSLLYPLAGETWVHSAELDVAMRLRPGAVEVLEGWIAECPPGQPFAWVEDAAAERLRHKAAGNPEAVVLKLGLNSIYGKLAQHTGKAPLQFLPYAAAITSITRSRLLEAALPAGHDVLLLATDGILSRRPLPLEVAERLGAWEYRSYPDAWIAQSGVYWAGAKLRTRGVDARSLSLDQIRAEWAAHRTRGAVTVRLRRVLSYQQAIAWGRPQDAGRWVDLERTVRLSPAPRRRPWKWEGDRLLTLPAHVEDYLLQALLDAPLAEHESIMDVVPDWMLE